MWDIGTLYFLLCFSAQLKLLFEILIFLKREILYRPHTQKDFLNYQKS